MFLERAPLQAACAWTWLPESPCGPQTSAEHDLVYYTRDPCTGGLLMEAG